MKKILRTKLQYNCNKREDFDYVEREWKIVYDRSFDMFVSASTKEECEKAMESFEDAIRAEKIQVCFDSNLEPEFDEKKNLWIGAVEVYVGNDYVTDEKEAIREVYREWKKSLYKILGVNEMGKKYELSNRLKAMKELIEKMEVETEKMLKASKDEKMKLTISGANDIINHIDNILDNLNGRIIIQLEEPHDNLILQNNKNGRLAIIKHDLKFDNNAPSNDTMISSEEKSYGEIHILYHNSFKVRNGIRSLEKFIRKEHYDFEESDYINAIDFYISNEQKINEEIEKKFEELFETKMKSLIDKVSNEESFIEKMNNFIK